MDKELKDALDKLGMTQAQAIEAQQKAHAEFVAANDANTAKRDAVFDEKLAKLQSELDKFEPLNKAMADAKARQDAEEAERKEMKEQLDRIETAQNRPNAGGITAADEAKIAAEKDAFFNMLRVGTDRMTPERRNVLTVSSDTGGGYLAPSAYLLEIIKAVVEYSPFRTLARVGSTNEKSVQIPKRTGVFAARWVGEVENRPETTGLAYGLEDVPVHELVADVRFSMANLEDSAFDLPAEVRAEFAEQFGVAEGAAFVSGNGVKRPQGFLNAAGSVQINSLDANTIKADGVLDLKYGIKTAYAKNGSFVLNRKSLREVRKLKDKNDQYLWMPGLAQGRPNTIDGDPYVEMPDMPDPAAGTKPMAYGDWNRAYRIFDRMQLAVTRDDISLASDGQVKFIARRRVGGQVVLAEAFAVMTVSASTN